MIRGTTPTNIFTTDQDLSDADAVYITYKQDGEIVLEKSKADITFDDGQFSIKLTQEETLRFSQKPVNIQIRAKYPDGTAIASNIIKTAVADVLKDGVI